MTQIAKIGVTRQCGVCGRTLLLGEQVEEFTNGVRRVSVCTLCLPEATARGWLRVGAPAPPPVEEDAPEQGERRGWRRKRRGVPEEEPPEPEPERSEPVPAARAIERGVDAFNASAYRRTVASIAKSLGVPKRQERSPKYEPASMTLSLKGGFLPTSTDSTEPARSTKTSSDTASPWRMSSSPTA